MSEQTSSWVVLMKTGDRARVDGVTEVQSDGDMLEMSSESSVLFLTPLSAIAYAQRVERCGMNGVEVPKAEDPAQVLDRLRSDPRFKGLL